MTQEVQQKIQYVLLTGKEAEENIDALSSGPMVVILTDGVSEGTRAIHEKVAEILRKNELIGIRARTVMGELLGHVHGKRMGKVGIALQKEMPDKFPDTTNADRKISKAITNTTQFNLAPWGIRVLTRQGLALLAPLEGPIEIPRPAPPTTQTTVTSVHTATLEALQAITEETIRTATLNPAVIKTIKRIHDATVQAINAVFERTIEALNHSQQPAEATQPATATAATAPVEAIHSQQPATTPPPQPNAETSQKTETSPKATLSPEEQEIFDFLFEMGVATKSNLEQIITQAFEETASAQGIPEALAQIRLERIGKIAQERAGKLQALARRLSPNVQATEQEQGFPEDLLIKYGPKKIKSQCNRRLETGSLEEALEIIERAMQIFPNDKEMGNKREGILLAISIVRNKKNMDELSTRELINASHALERMGELRHALACLEALARKPHNNRNITATRIQELRLLIEITEENPVPQANPTEIIQKPADPAVPASIAKPAPPVPQKASPQVKPKTPETPKTPAVKTPPNPVPPPAPVVTPEPERKKSDAEIASETASALITFLISLKTRSRTENSELIIPEGKIENLTREFEQILEKRIQTLINEHLKTTGRLNMEPMLKKSLIPSLKEGRVKNRLIDQLMKELSNLTT